MQQPAAGPHNCRRAGEAIDKHDDAIGDQIGDYLQQRGLFDDNPVPVRRENDDDGGMWTLLPLVLMGVGSGFWAALWLDQWWASALIGAFTCFAYTFPLWTDVALQGRTGMLKPTPAGAHEIGQWLGLKEFLAGSAATGPRDQSDPMLPYAVAINVAQPWLDVAAPAPPWFGSGEASSLRMRRPGRGLSRFHARAGVVADRAVGRCGESGRGARLRTRARAARFGVAGYREGCAPRDRRRNPGNRA